MLSDEEKARHELEMHQAYLARMKEQHRARIVKEGFEVSGLEPDGDVCHQSVTRKVKNRWQTVQCGAECQTVLKFVGPDNPDGLRVPLCNRHIAGLAKDLIGYLHD